MRIDPKRIRAQVRMCLGEMGRTAAAVTHADGSTDDVMGYKYAKESNGSWALAMPGQIADEPEGVFFMALYPDELPRVEPDDTISVDGGGAVRIVSVRDALGAYQTYRLAE